MEQQDKKKARAAYREREIVGGVFAVRNEATGKLLIQTAADLQGCQNRFNFSKATGSCVYMRLQEDWKRWGPESFTFEVLDTLKKGEDQTQQEFAQDIQTLRDLWLENHSEVDLYPSSEIKG